MNPKYLISLLERENLKLAELSRITGVPKSTLSSWLKGRSPNLEQLQRVADFFNVTLDFLVTGRSARSKESLIYKATLEEGAFEITIKKLPSS